MTDDERKRLNLLLADLDESDPEQDNAEEQHSSQVLDESVLLKNQFNCFLECSNLSPLVVQTCRECQLFPV